jgi:hypothetical protein
VMPNWLRIVPPASGLRGAVRSQPVPLSDGRRALLESRRSWRPLACLRVALGGRRPTSPELRRASQLFRLQRQGIESPRLLAFGQRTTWLGYVDSFVLVEPLPAERSEPSQERQRRVEEPVADAPGSDRTDQVPLPLRS